MLGYIQIGLNGKITESAYPLAGEGRINAVPLPAAAWQFGMGLVALSGLRRRQNKA